MSGPVLLQGGGELSRGCREMDEAFLTQVQGPVAVLALASAPGTDHDRTVARARTYYRTLGAQVLDVPDPRTQPVDHLLATAGLLVLTGGSPSRLRSGLGATGVGALLARHVAAGGAVSGASAGAMLLCGWTVLPDEGPRLDTGLGIVPEAVVLPHWREGRDDWLSVIDRGTVLGLPEESGVLIEGGGLTAVGRRPSVLVRTQTMLDVGTRIALPWVG